MSYPVEIKASVEPPFIDAALSKLKVKDGKAERRLIYFLDHRGQDGRYLLYAEGVIVRIRCGAGGQNDSTLKFRPCDVSRLPSGWKDATKREGWRIEWDWTGEHRVPSASLEVDRDDAQVDMALHEDPTAAFTADQLALFRKYTSHDLEPGRLRNLGPIHARKWKIEVSGHRVNCEAWDLGADVRFLELSGRADDADIALETQGDLLNLYTSLGLRISASPELKTKLVLDYFSKLATTS